MNMTIQPHRTGFGDEFLQLARLERGGLLWDTVQFNAGAMPARSIFFETPVGKTGSGFARNKTEEDTNLLQANTLSIGVMANVQEVRIGLHPFGQQRLSPDMQAFLNRISEEFLVRIRVNRKEQVGPRPLCMFDAIGPVMGELSMGAPAAQAIGSQGGTAEARGLMVSVPVPSLARFDVIVERNDNAADLLTIPEDFEFKMVCELRGQFTQLITI